MRQAPDQVAAQPLDDAKQALTEISFSPEERSAFEEFANYLVRNPRRIKRIVNIYRLVRLLSQQSPPFEAHTLVKWIILTEQWPFRTALVMQHVEDKVQAGVARHDVTLPDVYLEVRQHTKSEEAQPLAQLDGDPEVFTKLVELDPMLTVDDIQRLRSLTFNLNPAIQEEVVALLLKSEASSG